MNLNHTPMFEINIKNTFAIYLIIDVQRKFR